MSVRSEDRSRSPNCFPKITAEMDAKGGRSQTSFIFRHLRAKKEEKREREREREKRESVREKKENERERQRARERKRAKKRKKNVSLMESSAVRFCEFIFSSFCSCTQHLFTAIIKLFLFFFFFFPCRRWMCSSGRASILVCTRAVEKIFHEF